jgi:hypothetical protein
VGFRRGVSRGEVDPQQTLGGAGLAQCTMVFCTFLRLPQDVFLGPEPQLEWR